MTFSLAAQEKMDIYLDGRLQERKIFADSLDRHQWVHQQVLSFWSEGYLFSGVDSVAEGQLYMHRGERADGKISHLRVFSENLNRYDTVAEHTGRSLSRFPKEILSDYLNSGYPFARVSMDSLWLEGQHYKVLLSVQPGPAIVYDSIALVSDVKVSKSFLASLLEMKKDAPYSEKTFSDIPKRIRRVSFLDLAGTPDVGFSNGKAIVYLDIRQRSTNSFEGVVGFLPNQAAEERLVVTGYLDLSLANLFQSGKGLDLTWNRFADESQSLDVQYHHPFFLSSKIFLDGGFNLIKQDTSFLTQAWNVAIGSYLSSDFEVLFGYQNVNGSLISPDPGQLQAGFADYHTNRYSVMLRNSRYEEDFGFASGVMFSAGLSLGEKKIDVNSSIGSERYDSLDLRTSLIGLRGGLKYQHIMVGQTTLYHHLIAGSIFNDQILNNELARIGGLKTLRGFNENFFFAQHYALSRLEVRQYFERQSYFVAFYDQLFYLKDRAEDFPFGFGAGLALQTSNGLFSFALASGASETIPLDVSNVKIHLGYISRF